MRALYDAQNRGLQKNKQKKDVGKIAYFSILDHIISFLCGVEGICGGGRRADKVGKL